MLQLNLLANLLAQAPAAPAPEPTPFGGPFMVYLMGGLVIFMVVQMIFGRSDSKEKAKREAFIGSLKKNDPVVTIGGILGSVVSVSEDKTEVTIRVDDNTRLKMQATAIRESLASKTKETKDAKPE
ncbi:preprotein translocase subunit YajC [Planctomicrobium sp. SH661]|uniref:preprotein translocase subunit YajC n=1 Tax=Planctomicrobium sp. SH661 TaxID=3448124 RepID=UPI003F5C3C56